MAFAQAPGNTNLAAVKATEVAVAPQAVALAREVNTPSECSGASEYNEPVLPVPPSGGVDAEMQVGGLVVSPSGADQPPAVDGLPSAHSTKGSPVEAGGNRGRVCPHRSMALQLHTAV